MHCRVSDHDPSLVELTTGDDAVLVAPGLQGRIFCRLHDLMVHRFDPAPLATARTGEFRNLGGNSLWPAPEGGPYAFNYLPDSDNWLVQEGINTQNYHVTEQAPDRVRMEKVIHLTNRRGVRLHLRFRRSVALEPPPAFATGPALKVLTYTCQDEIAPLEKYDSRTVLLAAWSLEQFPGSDGILAFARVRKDPAKAVNTDFYGSPEARLEYRPSVCLFHLGGPERLQIGIRVDAEPELIGAFDRARGLLILRSTPRQSGLYFNIADNAQPRGPFSAADLYSIFNGGPLGFYELETIGAMQTAGASVQPSTLVSQTTIIQGPPEELSKLLNTLL